MRREGVALSRDMAQFPFVLLPRHAGWQLSCRPERRQKFSPEFPDEVCIALLTAAPLRESERCQARFCSVAVASENLPAMPSVRSLLLYLMFCPESKTPKHQQRRAPPFAPRAGQKSTELSAIATTTFGCGASPSKRPVSRKGGRPRLQHSFDVPLRVHPNKLSNRSVPDGFGSTRASFPFAVANLLVNGPVSVIINSFAGAGKHEHLPFKWNEF